MGVNRQTSYGPLGGIGPTGIAPQMSPLQQVRSSSPLRSTSPIRSRIPGTAWMLPETGSGTWTSTSAGNAEGVYERLQDSQEQLLKLRDAQKQALARCAAQCNTLLKASQNANTDTPLP